MSVSCKGPKKIGWVKKKIWIIFFSPKMCVSCMFHVDWEFELEGRKIF